MWIKKDVCIHGTFGGKTAWFFLLIGSSINAAPPLKRWAVVEYTIHCADLWKGVLSVSGRKQVVCGSKGKQELNGLKAKENSIKDMI